MFRIVDTHWFSAGLPATVLAQVALLATNLSVLRAQEVGDTWLLQISEKEMQLAYQDVPEAMKPIMWDVTYERNNYYRNMPTLELRNIAPTGSPDIVQFRMTIGDTRFQFGTDDLGAAIMQCPCHPSLINLTQMEMNGGSVDDRIRLTTPGITLTPSLSDNGNLLIIDISKQGGGGLSPGEMVRFKIDIDPDPNQPGIYRFPDYRTVLFRMNGLQPYGPTTDPNSVVTLLFSDQTTSEASFNDCERLGGGTCMNVPAPQSQFFNNNFRRYGIMEPVDIFQFGGNGGGTVIPEPSSGLLTAVALLAVIWFQGRSAHGSRRT